MKEIKAIVLCNNRIAVPAIKEFAFFKKVAAIGVPKKNTEMLYVIREMLKDSDIELLEIEKDTCANMLKKAITRHGADVVLMMTFPFIIPAALLSLPPKGFINFHYGLLPQCRGPQPILAHLLNNDAEGGVTVHKADAGIDTGAIIMQEKMPISDKDTYGTLQTKLAYLGAKLAANLLKILSFGTIIPAVAQDESKAAYHKTPVAKDLTINWETMTGAQIVRMSNACNPWNKAAGTFINSWNIGITEAEILEGTAPAHTKAGTVLTCNGESGLTVAAADNSIIRINIVYSNEGFFSGGRLAGFQVKAGDVFQS